MSQACSVNNSSLAAGFEKLGGFQQNKQKEMLEGIPLSRFGSKWDIAMACIYLASKLSVTAMLLSPPLWGKAHICHQQVMLWQMVIVPSITCMLNASMQLQMQCHKALMHETTCNSCAC